MDSSDGTGREERDERQAEGAEEPLLVAELEHIYKTGPMGRALLDTELRYLRINERLAAMHGVPAAAHIGRSIWEVLPQLAPLMEPVYRQVIASGEAIIERELRGNTPGNADVERVFLASYYPIRNHSGKVMALAAAVQDITAQKHVEEALRESERRFALFMQNLPGAAWMKDLRGCYVYANQEGERIFQTRLEELRGKSDEEVFPAEVAAQFRDNDRRTLASGRGIQTIETLPQPDGLHYSIVKKFPIVGDSGKPLLIGGVAFDITEQKHAEDELAQTAAELRKSNAELMRANEELRKAKEQFQLVTDSMAAAVTRCSRELRYVWVSRSYAAWVRRPPEEIEGMPIRDVVGDQGFEQILPYMQRVLSGETVEYTTQVNFLGAGERWIHAVYVPTYSPGHEVDGWIAVVTDITEQRRLFDQLRGADERLRALVANSSDGVVLLDEQGTVQFEGAPILGYGDHEWMGKDAMELVHPEERPAMLGKFSELLRQPGETLKLRYRARHKNGSWRWIEAICRNLLDQPAVHGIVVNYRDITEQQQIEDSLREKAQLLDLTQDAIFALRWDGAIEFWNRGAAERYGWVREEAVGQVAHQLLLTVFPEPLDRIKRKLAEYGYWEGELVHTARDGKKRIVASRWALRRGADDQPSGYLEIASDITERKHAEQQLRQTQRLESLGILAGGIAHDFNNLLVGILGNASLALDVLGPTTSARRMLEELIEAAERAANLTRQLLAYAGKEQLARQPVNLTSAVRDLTGLLKASLPQNVHLMLELSEVLPYVNADPTQLQQVIMNLVINAAEAIPQGTQGTVRITTAVRQPTAEDYRHAILPLAQGEESYVVFTVSDTGVGMTPEMQARIFDPFYTTKFAGRGLGLAAVLGIIKAHQGAICVASTPGAGTTFTLLFPQSAAAPASIAEAAAPGERSRGSGTILLADDEPAVRAVARRTLEHYGYQVLAAEDGLQAVEMLEKHVEVVAIVLDLAMPVMSGEEAARQIRKIRDNIPILLSSGYTEAEARQRFAGTGIAGFLQKPYRASTLIEKVSLVLEAGSDGQREA